MVNIQDFDSLNKFNFIKALIFEFNILGKYFEEDLFLCG